MVVFEVARRVMPGSVRAIFGFALAGFSVPASFAEPLPPGTPEPVVPAAIPSRTAAVEAAISDGVRRVFKTRAPAVIRVEANDRHGKLCGTGFFADPAGTIFTLYSTVADASDVTVISGDERFPAKVVAADARSGIAILKVDRETPFIPPGKSSSLGIASPLVCIGYPMDLPATPAFGLVGGFDRKYFGKYFVTTHLRANIPVQAGFGGAPVMNFDGEVVGILIAGFDRGSSCFALPIEAAEKIWKDSARFGGAKHGWVGVTVESQPDGEVRVAALGPETPAAKSGLREGDRLLSVGDVKVDEVEDVLDASFFLTDGDPVEIRVLRDGQELDFSATPTTHPASETQEYHATGLPAEFELRAK